MEGKMFGFTKLSKPVEDIGCKEVVWLSGYECTIEGIIEGSMLGCSEGYNKGSLLGLKDNINYGDKIWVDSSAQI